jgi:serine/threonine protein kinase
MEYVEGSSLLDIVKKTHRMDVLRAAHYVWQSSQGLDHAFRVGVIHRDIKPGNILVDRFGIAKILDMGLARFYHTEDDMLTLKYDEKSVLGTADYVAPEQTINSHDVDVRADIYSLGCTFYYLLAGHPPFPDGTIAQKLISHQTRMPTPIRQLRPEVPEAIAMVLDRMMAKSLNDRYQTPTQIYEALLPWVQSVNAVPPEEEMPLLSPAARESLASTSASSGSLSGSFRQDSAILRAEIMQRSGKLSSSGVRPAPTADQEGVATKPPGQGSSAIRPPFFEPPQPNPFSNPANPGHSGTVDTRRIQNGERTATDGQQPYQPPARVPETSKGLAKLLGSNPVIRIALETVIVFLLVMFMWWVGNLVGFFGGNK